VELNVLNKSNDTIEIEIIGERHTFPNLLRSELLKDSKVEFAAYKLEHPMDTSSKLVVKTKSGKPEKALTEAIKRIEEQISDFKKEIKKL